jgi:hypothetical protein
MAVNDSASQFATSSAAIGPPRGLPWGGGPFAAEWEGPSMNRHLETLGLVVACADLDVIPQATHWAYESEFSANKVAPAIERVGIPRNGAAPARAKGIDAAHGMAWLCRR